MPKPDGSEPSPVTAGDEPVPRLPRGKSFMLSGPALFRILIVAGMLVGVLMLRQPCAHGVANFVDHFDQRDAGAAIQTPEEKGAPDTQLQGEYVRITGDMSEAEIRQKLIQAGVADPALATDTGDAGAGHPDASSK